MEEDSASTMSNDDASVKSTSPSPLPINSKGIPLAGMCALHSSGLPKKRGGGGGLERGGVMLT